MSEYIFSFYPLDESCLVVVARGAVDRFADARIGTAATNVGDRGVDVFVGRLWYACQQRDCRHDHARLTIATLRDALCDPCCLHRVGFANRRNRFDCGDRCIANVGDGYRAASNYLTVQMDRTGAAKPNSAPVFGTGQAYMIAQYPKQGSVVGRLEAARLPVHQDPLFGHAIVQSRESGSRFGRAPPAAAIALHIAGATPGVPSSPAPPGGWSLSISAVSISGISKRSGIR